MWCNLCLGVAEFQIMRIGDQAWQRIQDEAGVSELLFDRRSSSENRRLSEEFDAADSVSSSSSATIVQKHGGIPSQPRQAHQSIADSSVVRSSKRSPPSNSSDASKANGFAESPLNYSQI
jgi:hypothetical protein